MTAGRSPLWVWPAPNGSRTRHTSPRFIGVTLLCQALYQAQRVGAGPLPGRQFLLQLGWNVGLGLIHANLHLRSFGKGRARYDNASFYHSGDCDGHGLRLQIGPAPAAARRNYGIALAGRALRWKPHRLRKFTPALTALPG